MYPLINSSVLMLHAQSAAPEFQSTTDAPSNVTVTEGETVTFSCNPFAMPGANIVWLQNEEPIDGELLCKQSLFQPVPYYLILKIFNS